MNHEIDTPQYLMGTKGLVDITQLNQAISHASISVFEKIVVVQCNESFTYSGGPGTFVFKLVLGAGTGMTGLSVTSYGVPDRFRIEWNGVEVANSKFIGRESSGWKQALLDLGYTEAEIELPTPVPASITLIVGQGGDSTVNTSKTYGGGGGSGDDGDATGGRGGGRTAIRIGSTEIATAGGGGKGMRLVEKESEVRNKTFVRKPIIYLWGNCNSTNFKKCKKLKKIIQRFKYI